MSAHRSLRRTVATLAATGLIAGPLAVVAAGPASAAERESRCDGAEFSLEVEREDGRFEVDIDIDDATPGSRWTIVAKQDGRNFVKTTRRADSDGDISLDRKRPNTRGSDTFRVTVNKVGTGGSCTHQIRFRR